MERKELHMVGETQVDGFQKIELVTKKVTVKRGCYRNTDVVIGGRIMIRFREGYR